MREGLRRSLDRYLPLVPIDALGVFTSFAIALLLRFEGVVPGQYLLSFVQAMPFVIVLYLLVNGAAGLYSRLWRYASSQEVITIIIACVVSTSSVCGLELVAEVRPALGRPLPLGVVCMGGFLCMGAFTVTRYRTRLLTGLVGRLERVVGSHGRRRVLVVGAGEAGQLLAWQLQARGMGHDYELVGFVDDNPRKRGMKVHGLQVLGDRYSIRELVQERSVDLIILAIHRLSGRDFRDILSLCHETSAQVKVLPDVLDAIDDQGLGSKLRSPRVEDLLGREPVEIDAVSCRQLLSHKVVLVTGAGGSIGSELCRQILRYGPRWLLLLDNNETALHNLELELAAAAGTAGVECLLADIVRREKLERIFEAYQPQVVFHSAAFKHVPKMEEHPDEAVWVNVEGTRNLTDLSSRSGVQRFVFISTDKAVRPCNIMGISKRLGELLVTTQTPKDGCLFTAVRFGNVLASRGSVVPTFGRQIDQGGPVTVTHPDAQRFFMTIEEAASLVIQAAALTEGGDIFILDMGQEIRIDDLAAKMIRLRGLRVGTDIEVKYVGLRPGEKLREELVGPDEEAKPTAHAKIVRVVNNSHAVDREWLLEQIDQLVDLAAGQRNGEIADRFRAVAAELGSGASRASSLETVGSPMPHIGQVESPPPGL
jgi:FlaA1/EpsC-like NDP-sugar epimerase